MKELKTTGSRLRLNLHGALNAATKETVILSEESINNDATIRLGEALLEKHPRSTLYVIFDNAKHYRSKTVLGHFCHSRLKPIFLPPYSPNLNLIERLWLLFHKRILYNRYYPTFQEFQSACLMFFANLKDSQPVLNTLLRDNFHLIGV